MAGVLHAPLTAIFLIAELTGGYELFIPLMISAAMAYTITKYVHPHSVYTMELGRRGELITHNKDQAVLTLMDIESVIETNFIALSPGQDLGHMVQDAIVKVQSKYLPCSRSRRRFIRYCPSGRRSPSHVPKKPLSRDKSTGPHAKPAGDYRCRPR